MTAWEARSGVSATVSLLGQFSYASADRAGGGSGGWQVLQRTEGVEPMLADLVRFTPATIESLVVIQDYPVPGMARRLMLTAVGGAARVAAWHSVPAGRDGSGRPGNVFTHGVVLAGISMPLVPGFPAPVSSASL